MLGEPVRMRILHELATADEPLTVGQITASAGIGQSTVSHHLAKLAEVDFVDVEHIANRSLWRINPVCISRVPSIADLVLGGHRSHRATEGPT
jgi:DNA-binding transcriptional ArsR family regulator